MNSYRQFCPIARGAEIFAERWTPIIVRNLLVGCQTFGEILQGAAGIPRSLLSQRLRLLERHRVVERRTGGRVGPGRPMADIAADLGGDAARIGANVDHIILERECLDRDHNGRCFTHRVRASVMASVARAAIPG
jgi:hypothetical protein